MQIVSYSANFDEESFRLLMERLAPKWPDIFTPTRVAEITAFCRSLKHNEERPFSFAVEHSGETVSVGLIAFADDIGFPDLEFFSFPNLIASIQAEHEHVCEELGY